MTDELHVPYLSDEVIENHADGILIKYNPDNNLPIPIEEIVEFDLRIKVYPMHNLVRAFDVEAFTSSDLTSITIDEDRIMNYPNRFRFSLAHELGHIVLHRDFFTKFSFKLAYDYSEFYNWLNPKLLNRLEIQANIFAGLILVPNRFLESQYSESCSFLAENSGYDSIDEFKKSLEFPDSVILHLSRRFEVSKQVISRRLTKTALIEDIYRY